MEYQPVSTAMGDEEPDGQYTVVFPHGCDVATIDPLGQKYPGEQGPEQAADDREEAAPKRPGAQA